MINKMAKDKEYELLNKCVLNYCKPHLQQLDINTDDLKVKLMHNHQLIEASVGATEDDKGKLCWAVTSIHYLGK
jgi:hypothetical protein